jgi:hypothetical protein
MMEPSSTEQQIFQTREIAVSDQPSHTDKPKAHREAVYPDRHQEVNPEVDLHVCQVEQDSTEAANRKRNHEVNRMVTKAHFERRVNAEYQ